MPQGVILQPKLLFVDGVSRGATLKPQDLKGLVMRPKIVFVSSVSERTNLNLELFYRFAKLIRLCSITFLCETDY